MSTFRDSAGRSREHTPLVRAYADLRASHDAAREDRFRRARAGLAPWGSSEDYHFRNDAEYYRIVEQARAFDRDDPVPGPFVERVLDNTLPDGTQLDPQTGDEALNLDLWERWRAWSTDPAACDAMGQLGFDDLERQVLRSQIFDGDVAVLLTAGGLQLAESHRLRSPSYGSGDNIVLGVELDAVRRPVRYWFAEDEIDPHHPAASFGAVVPRDAYDLRGRRQVLHVRDARRTSQTRGVSAFRTVFRTLDAIEDIHFAKLIQQQVTSCFAFILEQAASELGVPSPALGARTEAAQSGEATALEGIGPGTVYRAPPGVTAKGFAPQVPNAGYFEQMELALNLVAINLGEPLMIAMMRPDGNFSAYRGAVEQARMVWRRTQNALVRQFRTPVYLHLLDRWCLLDPRLAAARRRLGRRAFEQHQWNRPAWPYIDPQVDAAADLIRVQNGLISPRRLHAERGRDWEEIASETVLDNAYAIRAAKKAAREINAEFPDDPTPVVWRELIALPLPAGQSVSLVPVPQAAAPAAKPTAAPEPPRMPPQESTR